MIYPLYRTVTKLAKPLIRSHLAARLKNGKEDSDRWAERRGVPSRPRPKKKLVWFHGASNGESLSALPMINALRESHPDIAILITTGTISSAELMAKRLPEGVIHQYVPVDHPDWARRFFDHWYPDMVVWIESELWPNILYEIKKRSIPAVLVNARMSLRSFGRWRFLPGMARNVLSPFSLCLAQTKQDARHFSGLGAKNVEVVGNIKFASDALPYQSDDVLIMQKQIGNRPFWFFASTHEGEEEQAIALHKDMMKHHSNLLTIIAMRHPHRADAVMRMLDQSGLRTARRSMGQFPDAKTDVYVVDTLGEMGLFYALSDLVVIGGSFIPHGGHNPIEPTHLNCAILYGPHMFNFKEICSQMEQTDAVIPVRNLKELEKELLDLIQFDERREGYKKRALDLALQNKSVLPKIMDKILPLIE